MTTPTRPSSKLLAFEGLRGIASLVVVIWHLRLTFWVSFSKDLKDHLTFLPFPLARLIRAFLDGIHNGHVAVWIFWVMSAFVLSLRYFVQIKETSESRAYDYLEDATLRRYPRLLVPVLVSVLFAYLLLALGCMHNIELAHRFGPEYDQWLATMYTFPASFPESMKCAFWDSFFNYSNATSYNNVLWTMEKEFFGSLFLFAFLALFGQRSSRILLYPIIIVLSALLELHWLNAFVAGIMFCDWYINGKLKQPIPPPLAQSGGIFWRCFTHPLGAIVCWITVITLVSLPSFGGFTHLLVACAAVLLALVSPPTQRFLSGRVPVFLGKISFSLYLVHIPLICSFSCWFYLLLVPSCSHVQAAMYSSLATVALSIFGGYILYLIADKWSIGISRRLSSILLALSEKCVLFGSTQDTRKKQPE